MTKHASLVCIYSYLPYSCQLKIRVSLHCLIKSLFYLCLVAPVSWQGDLDRDTWTGIPGQGHLDRDTWTSLQNDETFKNRYWGWRWIRFYKGLISSRCSCIIIFRSNHLSFFIKWYIPSSWWADNLFFRTKKHPLRHQCFSKFCYFWQQQPPGNFPVHDTVNQHLQWHIIISCYNYLLRYWPAGLVFNNIRGTSREWIIECGTKGGRKVAQ